MNKIVNNILMAFSIATLLSACSDWTDTESITINQPDISKDNPELYQKYLNNLRNYKQSEHKHVYAWFDNSVKETINRAQHISNVPDSVDVINLMFPDNLCEREIQEMETTRTDKGTKFIFSIDYDKIKLIYDNKAKEEAERMKQEAKENEEVVESTLPDFITFMTDTVSTLFRTAHEYNYDGLSICYQGKGILHLTPSEKKEYLDNQNFFLGLINEFAERNPSKMYVFVGKPQNIVEKSFLEKCNMIFIPAVNAKDVNEFSLLVSLAATDGVPSDRLGIIVSTPSLDKEDTKTGYFANGNLAIPAATEFAISEHQSFKIKSLGIYNINNDFFNQQLIYKNTRTSIATLNPSIK